MAMKNYMWKLVLIFIQLLSKLYSTALVAVWKSESSVSLKHTVWKRKSYFQKKWHIIYIKNICYK